MPSGDTAGFDDDGRAERPRLVRLQSSSHTCTAPARSLWNKTRRSSTGAGQMSRQLPRGHERLGRLARAQPRDDADSRQVEYASRLPSGEMLSPLGGRDVAGDRLGGAAEARGAPARWRWRGGARRSSRPATARPRGRSNRAAASRRRARCRRGHLADDDDVGRVLRLPQRHDVAVGELRDVAIDRARRQPRDRLLAHAARIDRPAQDLIALADEDRAVARPRRKSRRAQPEPLAAAGAIAFDRQDAHLAPGVGRVHVARSILPSGETAPP